jgi:bifunctional non-homologous end joining protein LigD
MHARLVGGKAQLLTRTGLDWSHRCQFTIKALQALPVKSAYFDGELCAVGPDGVPAFSRLQAAMDDGRTDTLVFMVFDLLFLDGESTAGLPLLDRKERLRALLANEVRGLRFADHVRGDGPQFREHACKAGVEGVISKRVDRPYAPDDRGLWLKSKCLNREEFVVVGWTDPAGSRSHFGALLARLLHRGRTAPLCGARGDRLHGEGAWALGWDTQTPAGAPHAACRTAEARDALRLAARPVARALGAAGSRGGDEAIGGPD